MPNTPTQIHPMLVAALSAYKARFPFDGTYPTSRAYVDVALSRLWTVIDTTPDDDVAIGSAFGAFMAAIDAG